MAEKILMLALSPTMEEGTIVKWNKKEGDPIANGEVICEVETDKATMDYESIQEGTLLKILVKEGEGAKVEQPIAIIGKKGENIESLVAESASSNARAPKAAEAPAAPDARRPAAALASEPAVAGFASANGSRGGAGAGPVAAGARVELTPSGPAPAGGDGRIKSSPLARAIAKEAGVSLGTVSGSGPGGRIVKRDVEAAIAAGPAVAVLAAGAGPVAATQEIPVSGKRKVIAERLSQSMYTSPHYYIKMSVPADNLVRARTLLNAKRERKVSMNAFLIKFVAEALKRHPMVNSSWQGEKILVFGTIDVGLAVAQKDGLITPVVRDCGAKGVVQIDGELQALIDKALANKLKPEEYTGATFTISNLGSFGIEEFTAIINPPGSAILAVGAIKKEPVVGPDDEIRIQTSLKLTLSCDHRVIDGALGANFMKYLSDIIEDPVRVLY